MLVQFHARVSGIIAIYPTNKERGDMHHNYLCTGLSTVAGVTIQPLNPSTLCCLTVWMLNGVLLGLYAVNGYSIVMILKCGDNHYGVQNYLPHCSDFFRTK